MANQHKGEISVELEGQNYTLALTLNAMVEVEALFSLSFDEVMTKAATGSATHLRAIIWAMLRRHHSSITIDQAGELVTGSNLGRLTRMIGQAVKASGPDPADVPKNPDPTSAPPRKAGTGASSNSPRVALA